MEKDKAIQIAQAVQAGTAHDKVIKLAEFWLDNGNQTGGQNMEDKEARKAIRLLAEIIDKALGQTDCALSYKEWDMLRNLKDGNYGELNE